MDDIADFQSRASISFGGVEAIVCDNTDLFNAVQALEASGLRVVKIKETSDLESLEWGAQALRVRAQILIDAIGPMLRGVPMISDHYISGDTLVTLVLDRVASRYRRAMRICEMCEDASVSRIRILRKRALEPAVIALIAANGLRVSAPDGAELGAFSTLRLTFPPTFRELARHPIAEALLELATATDIYVAADHSDLYVLSVMPVLKRTLAVRPAILLFSRNVDAIALAERFSLQEAVEAGRLRILPWSTEPTEMLPIGPSWLTKRLSDTITNFAKTPDDALGGAIRALLAEAVALRLMPVLHFSACTQRAALVLLPNVASVVVAPGRLMEAMALIDVANAFDVPTYEIQAGPISARRALPPNAQKVFCIDGVSVKTYSEGFGVASDRLLMTGSPRIQELVAPMRRLSKARARAVLGRTLPMSGKRLLVVATQPVGVKTCVKVVRLVLEGCRACSDVQILIKPHPGEPQDYLDAYAALAADYERVSVAPRGSNPYLLTRACDWLATYASTLGLEAAELDTPVIVINPFDTRPPYDLKAAGVAVEANSREELAAILQDANLAARRSRRNVDSAGAIAEAILYMGENTACGS